VGRYFCPNDSVLDFGCSDGMLLTSLPGREKAGVEVNCFSRAFAVKNGFEVEATIDAFRGRTFTRIVSCHCLEHVPNPAATLDSLRPALAPGGKLVLNLPMDDCRAKPQRQWREGEVNQHLYAWTPLTLGNLLAVSGFRPESVRIHKFLYPSRPSWLHEWGVRFPAVYHAAARAYCAVRPRPQLVAIASLA
ncbi:MAG: class I SAM-dependent methyltransferase, partial [Planctomycetales bacterium]|nr:class I SAM-dependent methyltransferase [Planctomycetales bacterium]